jgi:hypothetical protein
MTWTTETPHEPLEIVSNSKTFGGQVTKYKYKVRIDRHHVRYRDLADQHLAVCSPRRAQHVFQPLPTCSRSQRKGCGARVPRWTYLHRRQWVLGDYSFQFMAGLTSDRCRCQKGGFIRDAAQHGIALLFPDTSPRGAGIEGEDDDWDFGTGMPRPQPHPLA